MKSILLLEQALAEYSKILEIHPSSSQAAFQSGLVLEKLKRPAEALANYRTALSLRPDSVPALNNLAWLLATSSDPAIADPQDALRLATHAANLTEFKQAPILDTLATAQFAAGMRDAAIATLQRAIPLANASGQAAFAKELEDKLLDYQGNQN